MDVIRLLPDSVANQIAAGEVIQRPASCLKELVENSLDAGAKRIQVIVRDAGRTLLQVIDDGCGMSERDARLAFERHATSKITNAEDLFSLRTMGFRGEALASICAVSQVELQTRKKEAEIGTLLEIHGSNVIRTEVCSCAVGTNIRISNLFYNVPVRRKFLKSDQTELRNLLNEFYRIALVYPKVAFTFVHNDEIVLELSVGTEKQRIEAIFGNAKRNVYTSNFLEVKTETDLVSIRGFICKPESATRKAEQYFFVNGRYMRHPYFLKAIQTAYSGTLPNDYQPSFFIYFDINPESIDVNIHPTKTEIKFADEQTIFQILMACVREGLGKFTLAPQLDFDTRGHIDIPILQEVSTQVPHVTVDPNYNPFHTRNSYPRSTDTLHSWESLYQPNIAANDSINIELEYTPALSNEDIEASFMWQYNEKFIVIPTEKGLLFVNQHRAHIAILYQQFLEQLKSQSGSTQQLLFPEILTLVTNDIIILNQLLPDLRFIGFELHQLSPDSFSIQGVPSQLTLDSPIPILQNILSMVRDMGANTQDEWRIQIASSIAEKTAIHYGKTLNIDEMRDMIKRLFMLKNISRTPKGKKIMALLSNEDLNKLF